MWNVDMLYIASVQKRYLKGHILSKRSPIDDSCEILYMPCLTGHLLELAVLSYQIQANLKKHLKKIRSCELLVRR